MLELAVGAVWIQSAVQETLGLAVHQLAWVIAFMALLYLLAPVGAWFLAGRPVEHGRCWEKLARASGRIGLCVPLCLHVHERVEANTVGLFRPRVFVTTACLSRLQEIYRHTRFDRAVMFLTPHPTLPKRMEAVQRGRMALI